MSHAILAALCMVVVDVFATVMVQAEAANRGWIAGAMDTIGWYPSIICTTLCVEALSTSGDSKVAVLILVGVANLLGTKFGQVVGKRLLTGDLPAWLGWFGRLFPTPGPSIEQRIDDIERHLAALAAAEARIDELEAQLAARAEVINPITERTTSP